MKKSLLIKAPLIIFICHQKSAKVENHVIKTLFCNIFYDLCFLKKTDKMVIFTENFLMSQKGPASDSVSEDKSLKGLKMEHLVIMFDWDNTIMASADFLKVVHQKTADKLKDQNINLRAEIPAIATKKKEDILRELFGDENLDKVLPVFKEVYNETFKPKELKMILGAKELLQKLNDAKIPVAIVSNYTEDGIKEHLELRNIDYSGIAIIGVDTASKTKPDVAPGLLALERLKIFPTLQKVKVIMIGDGITSDMIFAENMHKYLNKLDESSSCDGILFNSLLSGEPIFTQVEIEKFISGNFCVNNKEFQFNRSVTFGYGNVGRNIRNAIVPYNIVPEALEKQKAKLRPAAQLSKG